jgi:acetylornithine deacetylase/succinyl-diaminopimelate desuccinylase-like protein
MRRAAAVTLALLLAGPGAAAAAPRLSEAAGWLRDYLRIDTTNPPGSEHRAAAYLAYLLRRERIPTRLLVSPQGRASLYARLPAVEPDGSGPLVLSHHVDVVPAGPGWSVDPFAGAVAGERLWGRGALDDKSLGIAQLAAFIDLRRRRLPLRRDVVFLAVADEELGGAQGMAWLVAKHPDWLDEPWAVFNEGGASRVTGSGLLWWEVEVAQKRPLWLRVTARGRGGHASSFDPDSAAHQLIRALSRVLALPVRYRVTPAVRRYAAALAPLHKNRYHRELFAHIDDHIRPEGPTGPLLPGLRRLFVDTLQVTVVEASRSINVIPEEASALIDARLLPDSDADAFLAGVRGALGKDVEVEVVLSAPPAAPAPTDSPAYRCVAEVLGQSAPVVPSMLSGFTDSRFFRARGIPAYGVSPFALSALDAGGIHGVDERIPIAEFDRGVERMRRIVAACATR